MTHWRNILVILLVVAVLGGFLWLLFKSPGQIEERLRTVLGEDVCAEWRPRGFSQPGLDEIAVEEVVIPADPVHEWRELVVLTGLTFRTAGPFLPVAGQELSIECAGGEIKAEEARGIWNCARPAERLARLVRRAVLKEFSAREIVQFVVRRSEDKRPWLFRLGDLRIVPDPPAGIDITARVYHESWAGGTAAIDLNLESRSFAVSIEGDSFSGVGDLVGLIAGDLGGVEIGGTGELTVNGGSREGAVQWNATVRATDLRIDFPRLGLSLADLVGVVSVRGGEVRWDQLSGSMEGMVVTVSGEIPAAVERRARAGIDIAACALSGVWPRIAGSDQVRALLAPYPPGGIVAGKIGIERAAASTAWELSVDVSGPEIAFGSALRLEKARAEAWTEAGGELREGKLSWQGMVWNGIPGGRGEFAVKRANRRWSVTEVQLSGDGWSAAGDGEFASEGEAALTLRLKLAKVPIGVLFALAGVERAPRGTASGSIEVRHTAAATMAQEMLSLEDVELGPFLEKLGAAAPEVKDLVFPAGRARFKAAGGEVTLEPCVLAGAQHVIAVRGTLSAEGQGSVKVLVVERAGLLDEVLFASDPKSWPLPEGARARARCFELTGPVNGSLTPLPLEGYFGEAGSL